MYGIAGSDISQSTIEVWLCEEASIARDGDKAPSRGYDFWLFDEMLPLMYINLHSDNASLEVRVLPHASVILSLTVRLLLPLSNQNNIMNQFIIIVIGRHSVKVTSCCSRSLLSATKYQG